MGKSILLFLMLAFSLWAVAQYPPPAGQEGTTAIHADSSVFIDWAIACDVSRGFMDISLPDSGFVSAGESSFATGIADNSIVSLGDGGTAILTFNKAITNGPGPDFAVFENSFLDDYLELAFVEVSSNGVDFFRFPSVSLTQTEEQISPFGLLDAVKLHNLAGKYRVMYGAPFDLDDIEPTDNFDEFNVTHIRIISITGSIDMAYANYDSEGNIINDPWPTMFASGGFDLDAVGVINNSSNSIQSNYGRDLFQIFPNPAEQYLNLQFNTNDDPIAYSIIDIYRESLVHDDLNSKELSRIDLELIPTGIYFIIIYFEDFQVTQKFIKK